MDPSTVSELAGMLLTSACRDVPPDMVVIVFGDLPVLATSIHIYSYYTTLQRACLAESYSKLQFEAVLFLPKKVLIEAKRWLTATFSCPSPLVGRIA
jgi:hypothetical protein